MRFLLTSNGMCNQTLANALAEMAGKPAKGIKIGFIPTAVDGQGAGDNSWFIKQLTDLRKFGFMWVDIVDIAADGIKWKERLDGVDIIYAGGGNPYYLLDTMRKVGFKDWLTKRLDRKIYVGGSSGSIVMTPTINVAGIASYRSDNVPGIDDLTGLNLVDFEVGPHIPDWPPYEEADNYAKTTNNKFYAIDNESAIEVVDEKVKVVGEGRHRQYN